MSDGQVPTLVYFEKWADTEAAMDILSQVSNLRVECLRYDDDEAVNLERMAKAHFYQIASRVELRGPWMGNAWLLHHCPQLLAISSTGAGYDLVDVETCTAAGVLVCNQTGGNARAVAEHAVGLMLALSRCISSSDRSLRRRAGVNRFEFSGNNLEKKIVGIIGLGNIGTLTSAVCRHGFGMSVIAYDPLLSHEEILSRGATPVSRDEVFALADFVSVHCPRSADTLGSIGSREFALMKRSAYFINTARGGIHREDELAAALVGGEIAGAGLDVFLKEPPDPGHALLALDNVVATPHVAGMTVEAQTSVATYAATQWAEIAQGRRPPRLINPEAWPQFCRRFERAFGFSPEGFSS